jgi:hypothetical protein
MTRQQETILWLGLAIVIANIAVHWTDVKSVLFSPSASATASGGGSKTSLLSANQQAAPTVASNPGIATPANVVANG